MLHYTYHKHLHVFMDIHRESHVHDDVDFGMSKFAMS